MTVANVNVTKVLLKRGNTAQNNAYTGVNGEISIDTQAITLRIHDGTTVGGTVINAGGVAGSYSNTNAAAYLAAQSITSANIGAYQTWANARIQTLDANLGSASTNISGLLSNAAVQQSLLDSLTGNAASQATVLNTLTSNAVTQADSLTTLLSNAVAQQTSLIDLVANAAVQAQAIANVSGTYSNTNVAAYLTAVTGNILPSANVTYSLGDATHQWRDLWVSNNTIYIGNTPIRVDGGTLLVNNAPITAGSTYGNANVATYLSRGNVTVGNITIQDEYDQQWRFSSGALIWPAGDGTPTGPYIEGSTLMTVYPENDGEFRIQTYSTTAGGSRQWKFNSEGNLIVPDDATIWSDVDLRLYSEEGNIALGNQNGAWVFGSDGTLTLPPPGVIQGPGGTDSLVLSNFDGCVIIGSSSTYSQDYSQIFMSTFGGLSFSANSTTGGGVARSWAMNTNGNLTYPDGTITKGNVTYSPNTPNGVLNSFKWKFSDSTVGNDTVTLQWNLLDTTQGQWYLSTNNQGKQWVLDSDTQKLGFANTGDSVTGTVTFGTSANGGAGDLDDIELTSSTGNAYVRANNQSWIFDSTGNLTLPGIQTPFSQAGTILNVKGIVGTTSSSGANISGFSTVSVLTVKSERYQFSNGVSILDGISGGDTANLVNGAYTVSLDSNSDLTIPGGILSNNNIIISNRDSGDIADISINSADDITLQAKNRTEPGPTEGGDLNLYAGSGGIDDITVGAGPGGDLQIYAGDGGAGNVNVGAFGGAVSIVAGNGGAGSASARAGGGGGINITAGSGGSDNGAGGYNGGGVFITAGDSSDANLDRGSIVLTAGEGGDETSTGGYVQIIIPSVGTNPGGEWVFNNTGLTFEPPPNGEIFNPSTGNLTLGTVGNTIIRTIGGATYNWVFDDTGGLTLPGDITTAGNIGVGNISVQNIRTLESTVHLGQNAGRYNQGSSSIAIGVLAGNNSQGGSSIAMGYEAGKTTQGTYSIAIGDTAGQINQGLSSIAIGSTAGQSNQSDGAVAIGSYAGRFLQGNNAIAIGTAAGSGATVAQPDGSIIINGTGTDLEGTNSGLYIAPIRESSSGNVLYYDSATKEITYGAGSTYGNTEVNAYLQELSTIAFTSSPATISGLFTITTVVANVTANLTAGNVSSTNGFFWGNGAPYSTGGSSYGNTEVAAYLPGYNGILRGASLNTANAVITGGYISALTNVTVTTGNAGSWYAATVNATNANVTTAVATNFSTANAVITGGYATGLANLTVTGNISVGNLIGTDPNTVIITGAYSSTFDSTGNVTLPNVFVFSNATVIGNISSGPIASTGNITSSGNVIVTGNVISGGVLSSGKMGYSSGSTVTQTSSRGNGVTINALSGTIITANASMTSDQLDAFYVANNKVEYTKDIVVVEIVSNHNGVYAVWAVPSNDAGAGFWIYLRNITTSSSATQTITIRFMVLKAPND